MRLLTPRGAGGVAVLVVEGPDWRRRASALLADCDGRPIDPGKLRRPRLLTLQVEGRHLDQVLVVARREPSRVELHVHGSEVVLEALRRSVGLSVRPADEAERLLRHAASDAQLALALEQRGVDFAGFLAAAAGLAEPERRALAGDALARSVTARALAEPHRLVLCGAQNAGKSTLMNRLLARERALSGDRAGLTRDPVRELTCLDGYPYELVDTAGEGEVSSTLDGAAQRAARRERRGALRILVVDGSRGPAAEDAALIDARTLVVCNKDDLPRAPWHASFAADLYISCLDSSGWNRIRTDLGGRLTELRGLPAAGPVGGVAALSADQQAALLRLRDEGYASG